MKFYKTFRNFITHSTLSKWIFFFIIAGLMYALLISLVNTVLMPIVENLLNIENISNLRIILSERSVIRYGAFISIFIHIANILFSIFQTMRFINFLFKNKL